MNLKIGLGAVLGLLMTVIGGFASDGPDQEINDFVERKVTIPEKEVDRQLSWANEEEKKLGRLLFRKMADAIADVIVFVKSRGKVRPDGY